MATYNLYNGDGLSAIRRHDKYYIEAGDFHVLAEKTMFRIHGYFFARESEMFRQTLNVASSSCTKGTTDRSPFILQGVPAEDFEKLLWVFYNPQYSLYNTTVDDWICILNLADKWELKGVKELAIRELDQKPNLDVVSKLSIYQKYKADSAHIVPLYAELCRRDTPLTVDETRNIGIDSAVLVNTARERLRADPLYGGRSPLPAAIDDEDIEEVIKAQMAMVPGFLERHQT